MTPHELQDWLDRYVAAWRSYDPATIGDLFSADASYAYQPYGSALVGREAIVADWLGEQHPPDSWTAQYRPFAIDGSHAVAVGESRYVFPDGSVRADFRNVFLLQFDEEGRCRWFVEYYREVPAELRED
jgi:hypothetical protein